MKMMIFIIGVLEAALSMASPVKSNISSREISSEKPQQRLSAKDYIQDGLLCMYDGIENAGWGVHDNNIMIWKDLVGNRDLTVRSSGGSWSDNAFVCNGTTAGCSGNFSFNLENMTMECCISGLPTTYRALNFISTPASSQMNGGCAGIQVNGDTVFMTAHHRLVAAEKMSISSSGNNLKSFYQSRPTVWVNGNIIPAQGEKSINNFGQYCVIGARMNDAYGRVYYPCAGTIHVLRIYERKLTREEVLHNYRIDKSRFNFQ